MTDIRYQVASRGIDDEAWIMVFETKDPVAAVEATLSMSAPNKEVIVFENYVPIWETWAM